VIDGVSLMWAIENSLETRSVFFKLGYLSNSCICCRVSPAQKMQIVQLAKENGTWITLAVGDGANDVSMIQEAHIGVGIAGKEGTQAVQSADYSISQFRFLQRLLLVHGRWGYRRISWFICYYFYKNIAVVFTELCFAFMNGLSGQIYFLDWLPMLYNAFWTSWPCMFTFIFEQDLRDTEALAYPSTYQAGQRRLYFTFKTFWTWVSMSVWHGLICFWLSFQGLGFAVNSNGWDTGLWWISTVSFTMVIHVVTLKLFIESIYWNKVNTYLLSRLAGCLSIVSYYLTVVVLNVGAMANIFQSQLSQLFFNILKTPRFWCVIIAGPFLAVLPDIYFKAYHNVFIPNPIEKIIKMRGKRLPPPTTKGTSAGKAQRKTEVGKTGGKQAVVPTKHKKIIPN